MKKVLFRFFIITISLIAFSVILYFLERSDKMKRIGVGEPIKGIRRLQHNSAEFINAKKNIDFINSLNKNNAELRAINNAKTEMYLKNGYTTENVADAVNVLERASIYHPDNKEVKKVLKKARKDLKKIKRK